MDKPIKDMDEQEQQIKKLADDINPSEDAIPDSLAEATTAAPLDDDALGSHATEDSVKKTKHQ